jgi:hypothetical protein
LSQIDVRLLTEAEYGAWNRLVSHAAAGSIYSRPEYLDVLCRATGGRFQILGAFKGDTLIGGIGLYLERSRAGEVVSNRLLLYYNGFVTAPKTSNYPYERMAWQHGILAALESALMRRNLARIVIHNRSPISDVRLFQSRGWTARPSYTFVVSTQDREACWSRIQHNLRRLVRRGEEQGVVVGEDDDFVSFYQQHVQLHRRKGSPLYLSQDRFRDYFERLRAQGLCRLYHARLKDGSSAAAQLVLTDDHPVTHTVCATSDEAYLKLGVTPYLRWKVLEALSEDGYQANDLTDASLSDVSRFKGQLGGDLVTNMVLTRPATLSYRAYRAVGRLQSRVGHLARRIGTSRP